MKTTQRPAELIEQIIANPTGGVVGVVDGLLAACREHRLHIDWQNDACRVRAGEGEWEHLTPVPIRKSGFRAILARLGAICNEQTPDSVSPYGGEGELTVGSNPVVVVHLSFTNTTAEQRLELHTGTPAATTPPSVRGATGNSALNHTNVATSK